VISWDHSWRFIFCVRNIGLRPVPSGSPNWSKTWRLLMLLTPILIFRIGAKRRALAIIQSCTSRWQLRRLLTCWRWLELPRPPNLRGSVIAHRTSVDRIKDGGGKPESGYIRMISLPLDRLRDNAREIFSISFNITPLGDLSRLRFIVIFLLVQSALNNVGLEAGKNKNTGISGARRVTYKLLSAVETLIVNHSDIRYH